MIILSKLALKYRLILKHQLLQELKWISNDTTSCALLEKLGLSKDDSKQLSSNKYICKLTPKELSTLLNTLERLGFTKEDVLFKYPKILRLHPYVIDQRFKALEEGGLPVDKISLEFIQRYPRFSNSTVRDLKEKGLVHNNINVTRNILKYCDVPAHLYPSDNDDAQPFKIIQVSAVKCYVTWLFGFTEEELEKKFKIYSFKYRSIRLLKQNFDILTKQIEFPKEKIGRHLYLLLSHPGNLQDTVTRVPYIGMKPLKAVANLAPRMLYRPTDTLLEILQILKEFNIDESHASMFPEIFTIAPDTVRERLQILCSDPQYKTLMHNGRMLKSVTNYRELNKRAKILKDSKWRFYSADLLIVGRQTFDERVKLNPDYYKGTDILHFLHKEINLPRKEIHTILRQHALWNYVSLQTISSTLDLLRQAGFSNVQITSALAVTLYPTSEVEKCMKELNQNPEVECCRDPGTGKVRLDLVLQLVLYFLERPFHFTGNGVWELDSAPSDQSQ